MTLPSPLIFIPKKATQDVDFAPTLRTVIHKSYSESPDAYTDEIAALNRARQDALRGSAGSDATARDLLYKYFGQLELLELRFPDLRVPFPWSDAFTHVKISQQSLAYEKASVIFTIGATLASLAASSPRSAPEGLKRAFHAFRAAAGMFVYINDNFLHAPSTDLSKDVVKLLVGLMTAQATEVFIETMGPATAKGAGLRSKLCMQVSAAYAGLVEEVKEWVGKGVFLREWSLLIQAKAKYFASLAQYHRSVADNAAGKYGEALARLQVSEAAAKEAHRLSQTFTTSFSTTSTATSLAPDAPVALAELTKAHLALVTEAAAKAQKDNDIVYNEVVPSEASLSAIDKGKAVAEPIPIHDVYATADVQKIVGPDLFARLVPLSVHESASLYSEEMAKLVRAEAERAELADEELASALEYMGLPASLARFQSGAAAQSSLADPGPQVRGWADEVRAGEASSSSTRADESFRRLAAQRDSASRTLDSVASALDAESRECEALRARYGHLWTQSPSSSATRGFRADLRAHRESLDAAGRSDQQARALWDQVRRDVGVLADPSGDALERAYAEAIGGAGAEKDLLDDDGTEEEEETKRRVAEVSDALSRLNKIKRERGEVLRDLKDKVQADDISHILILNRKGAADVQPALFATELEKFRPHQQRLTQTLQAQQSTLADVNSAFKALSEGTKARQVQGQWAAAERKKKDLSSRFGHAAQVYADVRQALDKGSQFYGDLLELVEGLQSQASSWLAGRTSERDRLASEADLKQRLEGGGGGSSSSAASPGGLDRAMGALSLGGARSPPPNLSYPSPSPQPSYPNPSSHAQYHQPSPPPPPSNPYGALPSSGAFSTGSTSPYQNRAPSYPSPAPPVPPPAPYGASSSYSTAPAHSPYGQPQQQRQPSVPPPPPTPSTPSYLPPPLKPVSYASSPAHQPYGQPPSNPYASLPPPPPQHQQYSYGQQQPPPPPQQHGQPAYGGPPAPPQPPRAPPRPY
ncbi:uncharacterized protein RHOBADRAFT_49041 [Rhodotorula graminis WP1]|uniref:BRO domain-containing protein 1 n=1 Tax=Rhodotorula graminis (strain WP1) TaxID=578459 RepID=A0A0P9GFP9_RHOGW|nr:uncharacterized protein RHOBADRAFT_49041 [Rhodotorula graminis WP1]KPV71620.1 hypothetical protein RHOBADRAFT_49041 [Rhodotorula graminis WP1]